jgi:hypothetical protein
MAESSPSPRWINRGKAPYSFDILSVEQRKNAVYMGDFCMKMKSGEWSEDTVMVFFNETPPDPTYSQYFGLFVSEQIVYIKNAVSASIGHWNGLVADDGEIIYSRCRHDFRSSRDGSVSVDGGRDYFRCLGHIGNPRVRLTLVRDRLVINDSLYLPVTPPDA